MGSGVAEALGEAATVWGLRGGVTRGGAASGWANANGAHHD